MNDDLDYIFSGPRSLLRLARNSSVRFSSSGVSGVFVFSLENSRIAAIRFASSCSTDFGVTGFSWVILCKEYGTMFYDPLEHIHRKDIAFSVENMRYTWGYILWRILKMYEQWQVSGNMLGFRLKIGES